MHMGMMADGVTTHRFNVYVWGMAGRFDRWKRCLKHNIFVFLHLYDFIKGFFMNVLFSIEL